MNGKQFPTNELVKKDYMEAVSCPESDSETAGGCPLSCAYFSG